MKNQLNIPLDRLCAEGIKREVFGAVSAAVSKNTNGTWGRSSCAGGKNRCDEKGQIVDKTTFFDLASLTKPLCTSLCALNMIFEGKLSLDKKISYFFSQKKITGKDIHIFNLLNHSSGIVNYKKFFEKFYPFYSYLNKKIIIKNIIEEKLVYNTGSKELYSDFDFFVLGLIIEKISAVTIDKYYKYHINNFSFSDELLFFPISNDKKNEKYSFAATELCPWRNKIMQGEVHDEHCWLVGGVAGHAGLFGTARAVLSLCELLVDVIKGRVKHQAFSQELLYEALIKKKPDTSWRFGFDTPSPGCSSSGKFFSPMTIGHLGFSGTSFWIDIEREIVVVLLTNRIHPSRANIKIQKFRPYFHDEIMATLK